MTGARVKPGWDRWVDRFAGSDPGLNRFRTALQIALTAAVILGAEGLFVHVTHALQIQADGTRLPHAAAAEIAAANHAHLVLAIVLGILLGVLSHFGVIERTARGQLVTTLILPVPLIGGLALGVALGGHRIPSLVTLGVVIAVSVYFRRFGSRGFIVGALLFAGDYAALYLHGAFTLGDLGWVAAEICLADAVVAAVRFIGFYPRRASALRRTQRSYDARARKVAALALELLDSPGRPERDARQLHRQLARLNEAALMIDARLGDAGAVAGGPTAQRLHQRLFDAELALTNIARFTQAMARSGLPEAQHLEARLALREVARGNNKGAKAHAARLLDLLGRTGSAQPGADPAVAVVAHRFAGSVIALADAMAEWMAPGASGEGTVTFRPSVQLSDGWLPGSVMVSNLASREPGARRADRVRLPLHVRTALQASVAGGTAIVLGDLRSGHYLYWAVLASYITFVGVSNSGEQVRRAFFRVAGTAVGVVIGSLLVSAVGPHTYVGIAVILIGLFFGYYLIRINYAFCVIGNSVMLSQLYVQLGEFSDSLLELRTEETAIGAAAAILAVMVVFPLRTRRVLRVAVRHHVQAVGRLTGHATHQLLGGDQDAGAVILRSDARAVDAAYQTVAATARPVLRNLAGTVDEGVGQAMRLTTAARNYSRNLVTDTEQAWLGDPGTRLDVELASVTLRQSLDVVAAALTGPRHGVYTRSAALFDQAESRVYGHAGAVGPAQLAIRDLKLIDGTMARMAEVLGLTVTDYDTVPAASASPGGTLVRGRVRGPDGAGVPAALTLIDPLGRPAARAMADASGGYWLDAPAAGAYTLIASAASHRPAASAVIVPSPGNGGAAVVNVLLAAVGVPAHTAAGTRPARGGRHRRGRPVRSA